VRRATPLGEVEQVEPTLQTLESHADPFTPPGRPIPRVAVRDAPTVAREEDLFTRRGNRRAPVRPPPDALPMGEVLRRAEPVPAPLVEQRRRAIFEGIPHVPPAAEAASAPRVDDASSRGRVAVRAAAAAAWARSSPWGGSGRSGRSGRWRTVAVVVTGIVGGLLAFRASARVTTAFLEGERRDATPGAAAAAVVAGAAGGAPGAPPPRAGATSPTGTVAVPGATSPTGTVAVPGATSATGTVAVPGATGTVAVPGATGTVAVPGATSATRAAPFVASSPDTPSRPRSELPRPTRPGPTLSSIDSRPGRAAAIPAQGVAGAPSAPATAGRVAWRPAR